MNCRPRRIFTFFVLFAVLIPAATSEQPANRFVLSQWKWGEHWDPTPDVWTSTVHQLERTTSIHPWPERRVLMIQDPALFESPFLLLQGNGRPRLNDDDVVRLRHYLDGGGFLFIDNTDAVRKSAFADEIAGWPARLFPNGQWRPIPTDNALYRSFYLLRRAAGRRRVEADLQGCWVQGRLAMVYSANDLLGALTCDRTGRPLYACAPDGESQRRESQRLWLNILLFSLTGTYKTDAIHQPFLERKQHREDVP